MVDMKRRFQKSEAALGMIFTQVVLTGMMLLSRIVLDQGTFAFALLAYRNIVAAVFIFPFAYFKEREMGSKLTWLALPWIFINATFGTTLSLGLYYYGLKDTTATYASNFLNMVPVVTFALAVLIGMEKLGLRSKGGRIKIAATLLCVGGALILSLYKGKAFHLWSSHSHSHLDISINETSNTNWTRGTLLLIGSCLSWSVWYIAQAKLFNVYPSKYWATMLTCVMGALQSTMIGISMDRSRDAWRLQWNLELVTILYSGALATAANFCLIQWVVAKRGPIYPSMFGPLSLIFVAISEALFLGEAITVGTILGMFLIIMGLYAYVWGKKRESSKFPTENGSAGDMGTFSELTKATGASLAFDNGMVVKEVEGKEDMEVIVLCK